MRLKGAKDATEVPQEDSSDIFKSAAALKELPLTLECNNCILTAHV